MNPFDATVSSLIELAETDFTISEALHEVPHSKEIEGVVQYLRDSGILIWQQDLGRGAEQVLLDQALRKLAAMPVKKVMFRQLAAPYIFKVYSSSFVLYLPLVLTRAFLSLMRSWHIKCEAEKRNKSLCTDTDICFAELAFTGKSSKAVPALKPIADACKKIKGRINPWTADSEVSEKEPEGIYNEANLRFRGAEWFKEAMRDVTLVGAGGLGSNIAVSLCRVLGNRHLGIWDPDYVEHKNLAGQNFGVSDIGKLKRAVVMEQCLNFNPALHVYTGESFNEHSDESRITITGLDSMAARSLVYSKWQKLLEIHQDKSEMLLIDARLSAEKWQIFCITGDNKAAQKEYESSWLFSDSEADSDVCSYKQTAYAAQMCAGFVTNLYVNFCTNLAKPKDDPTRRYLPFMTEYDATQMILRFKKII